MRSVILIALFFGCSLLSGANPIDGPHESVFCSRPSLECFQASSGSKMTNYYDPATTWQAASLMAAVAGRFRGNDNFEYALEEPWTLDRTPYSPVPEGDAITVCRDLISRYADIFSF